MMEKLWLRWFLALVLLVTGLAGLHEFWAEFSEAVGLGQKLVTEAAVAYGVAGICAALGLMLRRPWALAFVALWGAATVVAASLAATVYGDAPIIASAFAGIVMAVLAFLVYFYSRKALSASVRK